MRYISLFICLVITGSIFSQEDKVAYFKTDKTFVYADNEPDSFYAIEIPGDSINLSEIQGAFKVDDYIIQFIKNPYSTEEYTNKMDSIKEIELLKSKMKWELDYIQDEVLKQKVKSNYNVFKNKLGKRFLLWEYRLPEMDYSDIDVQTIKNYFLTFVANRYVACISIPAFEDNDDISNFLHRISENIRVYGSEINLDALYYQVDAKDDEREIVYTDSLSHYEIEIPKWFNVINTNSNIVFGGTFPDIDNIKNAIIISPYKKETFDSSFSKFNNENVLKLKIGDKLGGGTVLLTKEIETPKSVNGVAYKIQVARGSSIYENVCYTLDTGSHYLLVFFTSTPKTIKRNMHLLNDLISRIKILN